MNSYPVLRILIVASEMDYLNSLREGLEKLGMPFEIETADHGDTALAKLKTTSYDMVITDHKLPGASGLVLTQQIQQHTPKTKVILLTDYATETLRRDVIGSLALEAFLEKPVKLEEFRRIIQRAFSKTYIASRGSHPVAASPQSISNLHQLLQTYKALANARCLLVLNSNGHLVDQCGDISELDVNSISALVAANFMAGMELARLLGNNAVFKVSYHEGPNYNIYSNSRSELLTLAILPERNS